jgi:predicted nucleic acid-binding Zn ribbon protein
MILKDLKTFVGSIKITAETFILLMKRISTTTAVMCGEHLRKQIANIKIIIKGTSTDENMAS